MLLTYSPERLRRFHSAEEVVLRGTGQSCHVNMATAVERGFERGASSLGACLQVGRVALEAHSQARVGDVQLQVLGPDAGRDVQVGVDLAEGLVPLVHLLPGAGHERQALAGGELLGHAARGAPLRAGKSKPASGARGGGGAGKRRPLGAAGSELTPWSPADSPLAAPGSGFEPPPLSWRAPRHPGLTGHPRGCPSAGPGAEQRLDRR